MKSLHELIEFLAIDLQQQKMAASESLVLMRQLSHLYTSSSEITENSVFIALPGSRCHGIEYMDQAIERGAVCILTDHLPEHIESTDVPVFLVNDLVEQLSGLADWFYQRPSQRVKVIGITGTNGKTSTAHYIAQLLSQQHSVGVLGTLGNGVLGQLIPSANTTLEVVSLNRKLEEFARLGVEYVVMEVSSHAIALGRIQNIRFEGLALTQVTRDHLDFHETEEAYRETKAKLFLEYPAKFRVLNLGDSLGKSIMETLAQSIGEVVFGYALNDSFCELAKSDLKSESDAMFSCVSFKELSFVPAGMDGVISLSLFKKSESLGHSDLTFNAGLMGTFNAENLLCAVTVAYGCGLPLSEIETGVHALTPVSGRMEKVHEQPLILIDYAHTPDALASALHAVQQHFASSGDGEQKQGKLWLVFGCGGDRDKGKRPLMGEVAEKLADFIIITDDNPRNEAPEDIVADIIKGMSKASAAQIIHDRAQAVEYAIRHAEPCDIVMIAGKGHENYQEIQGQRFFMSDAVLADLTLREIEQEAASEADIRKTDTGKIDL
jgi:UDP-N-acetylmuramoyl-L-alanyl-D-glutamate--2,6-diaminopimelate ligase